MNEKKMILKSGEMHKSSDYTKDYIGNSKKITINENKHHIRIVGNDNKIFLTINSGTLEIIGNSTMVRIINNRGKLEYTGNNGKIYLCHDSLVTSVKYTGNNGTIKLVPKDEIQQKKNPNVISPHNKNHFRLDEGFSNMFNRTFNSFTNNSFFGTNNLSMPNLGGFKLDVEVIKTAQSNIVINRNS